MHGPQRKRLGPYSMVLRLPGAHSLNHMPGKAVNKHIVYPKHQVLLICNENKEIYVANLMIQ